MADSGRGRQTPRTAWDEPIERDNFLQRIEGLQTRIPRFDEFLRKFSDEYIAAKQDLLDLKIDYEIKLEHSASNTVSIQGLEAKLAEFEEVVGNLRTDKDRLEQMVQTKERELKSKSEEVKNLEENQRRKNEEISHLRSRLSQVMGNKLTDGNPAIADLSDKNRPSKLGEKFSELYDNAWTDAYEEIRKTSDEKDTIKKLLQILMYVNEKCKDFWTEYVTSLQKSIKAGSILELPDYIMKQIKDFSRNVAPLLVDQIHKQLLDKWYDYSTSKIIRSRTCEDYVKGCVECCWIMAAQDPPVEIDIKSRMNENFDNNLFRAYTQTGDRLEYVVWPPLYLHENGAILCKGVAQAVRNERSRSAPAASKDRTPGFDESKSFTGSISNQSSKQRNKNTDLFSQSLVASTSSPVNVDITEAGRKLSTNTIGQDSHSPLNKTSYQQTSYQQTNTQYPVAMDTTHQTPQINLPQTNNQQPTLQQSHINPMTGIHKSSLSPPTATGHVLWKHGRFPTNQEMERFLGYLKRGYSEFYTRIKMGDYVFNLCKDYNIYWTQLHQV